MDAIETEFVTDKPHECLGWVTHKAADDLQIKYWFEPTESGTRVRHGGVSVLDDESPPAFAADLDALLERYENNEVEMSNLKSILEDGEH